MSNFIQDLRKIYRDFYGKNTPMPDDDQLASFLLGDQSRELLKDLDDALLTAASGNSKDSALSDSERSRKEAAAKETAEEKKEPEKPAIDELNELIGLTTIKHDVAELVALAKIKKLREEKGMKAVPVSLHLVFSGNPGTGKTTVARILARLYKEIGILSKGQLVEVDRSSLVAGYVGQTAIKTQERIQEAMGGILFIDEAYALSQDHDTFGQESIDTILKAMEDHRDDLIVIVAGYTDLMKEFINSNPGLKSRFNKYFEFPDYTAEELISIFGLQCKKYQYTMTEEADAKVKEMITELEAHKGENFANARSVRNLFESIITNQAARVSELSDLTDEMLTQITVEDLADIELPKDESKSENGQQAMDDLIESLEKLSGKSEDTAAESPDAPE